MGYSFRITARVLLYASSHRQDDNTYQSLLYQSWSTGWNEKYLNGSIPWRIDPTTHRTMSKRSYHRATSRSCVVEVASEGNVNIAQYLRKCGQKHALQRDGSWTTNITPLPFPVWKKLKVTGPKKLALQRTFFVLKNCTFKTDYQLVLNSTEFCSSLWILCSKWEFDSEQSIPCIIWKEGRKCFI